MIINKFLLQRVTFVFAITLVLISLISYPIRVQSTSVKSLVDGNQGSKNASFKPRDRGRASKRTATAVRTGTDQGSSCPPLKELKREPLTALVPLIEDNLTKDDSDNLLLGEELSLAGTLERYPSFWFYIPYESPDTNNRPLQAHFKVLDENEQYVYKTQSPLNLSTKPGIIKITLPQTAQSLGLEEGKQYRWTLEILCHPNDSSKNPRVYGWTMRDSLSGEDKDKLTNLNDATVQQKLDFYLSRSIWHEALTLLAQYRTENPHDTTFNDYWNELLKDNLLSTIADHEVVQCCSFE